MKSLKHLYRIGMGPSSSHTMGPRQAACQWLARSGNAVRHRVTLYGSLAATGRGHLTDKALIDTLAPGEVEIVWQPGEALPEHPNGLLFEGWTADGTALPEWTVFSVGGGELRDPLQPQEDEAELYPLSSAEIILKWSADTGRPLWQFVLECEGPGIMDHLRDVWRCMRESLQHGLHCDDVLPGPLHFERKASRYFARARGLVDNQTALVAAYALAVSEENAAGGEVVTAPTCGSCGIVPAVLYYLQQRNDNTEDDILQALAVAGLFGNVAKTNASISGAEVGCQGEVGVACAMAAAGAAQLLGGSSLQIEYAAEMGLEHHLGLTCDPVAGLVQIPCIERNVMAAHRAFDCAEYALLSDGRHHISYDRVVAVMLETGQNIPSLYRETSLGGLARE